MDIEPPAKGGAPRWMATFADMSTLLLTFFVLMLSFASIDVEKFREMLGSVLEAYGVTKKVKGEYQPVIKNTEVEQTPEVSEEPDLMPVAVKIEKIEKEGEKLGKGKGEGGEQTPLEQMEENLQASISENSLEDNAEIFVGENSIRIRISGIVMFEKGGTELRGEMVPFLGTVIKAMGLFDYNLIVEGHSDNLPIRSEQFPSNWELSASRASSVIRHLIDNGVDAKRVSAIGYSDNYPIDSNDTPLGRAKNRRVELIFTQNNLRTALSE